MKLKILILIVSFLYILKHVNKILNNYTFEKSVEVKSSECNCVQVCYGKHYINFLHVYYRKHVFFIIFCMVNEIKKILKKMVLCVIDDIIHAFTNTRHVLCRLIIKIIIYSP